MPDQATGTDAHPQTESGIRARLRQNRERIRANRGLDLAYRITVGVVGGLIVLGGIILLPLPGPGWVIIFLGIGLWATEFVWAKRLLQFARRNVKAWTEWIGRQEWWVRALLGLAVLLIVAAVIAGYVWWKGVPGWIPFIG